MRQTVLGGYPVPGIQSMKEARMTFLLAPLGFGIANVLINILIRTVTDR